MPCLVSAKKWLAESEMCFSGGIPNSSAGCARLATRLTPQASLESYCPILPGLPDDVAKYCLALIPRSYFPVMGTVCKRWMSFIQSREFEAVRKQAGKLEEWLYVLTANADGKGSHWEVLSHFGNKHHLLPPMPGPVKTGFGVVVLDGKLLVLAGYSVDNDNGTECVSSDVYQYDSRLNRWMERLNELERKRFRRERMRASINRPPTPDADEQQAREPAVIEIINVKMVESGEKEKLKELLRERLIECGWRDEMKALCRAYAKKKGRNNVTIEELVQVITPKGRASIPDSVKTELLQRIQSFLTSVVL
ncbi:hypothetical protein J5N97_007230 [Dioscorea zingiberensis]|uniref:Transcription and mRNA export factor ENY2 n=1 Tax=Dioscorea zingiberensis TaxID=325984 RepID=A0A9D5DC78_9LILI|nr:hypothetical protein J5N97_007230 [Dioscorea zingiberensis]